MNRRSRRHHARHDRAGVSAGGFASIALSADPPPGLAAVINFAGGRGSRADNDVCDEAALVRAFATMGKTSRIPMLWVYAGNDKFFGPELAQRMHAAFTAAGGHARFIDAPAFGRDGHTLFSAIGAPVWTPMVDAFLREMKLGTRDLIAAPAASGAAAAAAVERTRPQRFCRLPRQRPAQGFRGVAEGPLRFPQRIANASAGRGRGPCRMRETCAGLRAVCDRR